MVQEAEIEVADLSSPLAVSETERGLQTIVSLPPNAERHLRPDAVKVLQEIGQGFVQAILIEAQRLATSDSKKLGLDITGRHIIQAEILERKGRSTARRIWAHLRDVSLAGLGAGLGNIFSNKDLALGLIIGFGLLLFISSHRD